MKRRENQLAKVIHLEDYDRTLGCDELNLSEFPLACLADRHSQGTNTLLFEDSVFDEGAQRQIHRSLVIAGSDHFGLPTSVDTDILLLLTHLTNVRNGFESKQVEFSRYELIKFLGWSDDGRSYRRLDESLRRWTSVSLHYKHAWWQRSKKAWKSRSFHVIESLELRGRDDRDDGLSSFTWSEVIHESFVAGNLRRIDLNVYFGLKSAISKQMFRFLDKRFYRSGNLIFDLKVFALEHIGLSRSYDTHDLKRKLMIGIVELEQIGFLVPLPKEERFIKLRAGEWEVRFLKAVSKKDKDEENPLLTALKGRGITAKAAEQLIRKFPKDYIEEKLAYVDELVGKSDPRVKKNPAGFLVSAISEDYKVPAQKMEIRERKKIPLKRPKRALDESPGSSTSFLALWESFSMDEKARIEREALSAAPKFHRDTLARLSTANNKLKAEMRLKLIEDYLKKQEGR